jgi:hypothetical protein
VIRTLALSLAEQPFSVTEGQALNGRTGNLEKYCPQPALMWTDKSGPMFIAGRGGPDLVRGISLTTPSEILSEIGSSLPTFSAGLEMKCLDDCRNWPFV